MRAPECASIGPLTLVDTGDRRAYEGATLQKGVRSTGLARIFDVSGSGLSVEIADITFDNGARDVRMRSRRDVESLDRLMHGLRIGVQALPDSRWFVHLRFPAVGSQGTVTQHKTDLETLETRCRFDVKDALVRAGAAAVNRRELAFGDAGRRREELCAVFDSEYSIVPAAAYTLTPLLTYYTEFC